MNKAVIVEAKRTPIGRKDGMLKQFGADELLSPLLKHAARMSQNKLDDVIIGNVVGPGGNVARLAALEAELPISIPGLTLDRQCSAGLDAIRLACCLIQAGAGNGYIAGGVESTSTSPFQSRARFSPDKIGDPDMGAAAENVASKYGITRKLQDEYTLLSYERSIHAFKHSLFSQEILAVNEYNQDEEFLKERNIEKLVRRARPVFNKENGTVTAANSCGINDGACVALVMEEGLAIEMGLQPVLRYLDSVVCGVHPDYPGIGPVPAIQQLLNRNNLTIAEIDLVELNEPFAAKVVACSKALSIPYSKLNVHGGALAIGHPYGASGAMLITRLFYEVQRRKNCNYVLAAIGSGGGIGLAVLFEVICEKKQRLS
ncbi:acetyl-CoA C-acyltransferase [uncultured Metabacillus sp.]|uniref:acetyl-CoA C-acyltransferase n=1 Tax=uncultured Metabacillus sp. TaxID=2860135 RepID=UPI00262B1469|nr:acetyl-CoA C-acyltransferase [uncultured Metabacillus sp.]